jgi:hypothetical protein
MRGLLTKIYREPTLDIRILGITQGLLTLLSFYKKERKPCEGTLELLVWVWNKATISIFPI